MNDSFLSLCHTYERSDHAWKLFRNAFGTCHALYTVFIERIAHEQKPHFCWSLGPLFSVILFFLLTEADIFLKASLGPLFSVILFFFTDRSGHLSKSFSYKRSNYRILGHFTFTFQKAFSI